MPAAPRASSRPLVMALLVFTAHDIDASGMAVEAPLPRAWLAAELSDGDLTPLGDGHIEGRMSRVGGDDIVVRGHVTAKVQTTCARCLGSAELALKGELSLFLKPVAKASPVKPGTGKRLPRESAETPEKKKKRPEPPPEYEFSSGEADEDTYDGEQVVLDDFVREALLLEVPNFPLCSESCAGIGAAAVQPEEPSSSTDPRLAPLGALREKLARAAAANKTSPTKKGK